MQSFAALQTLWQFSSTLKREVRGVEPVDLCHPERGASLHGAAGSRAGTATSHVSPRNVWGRNDPTTARRDRLRSISADHCARDLRPIVYPHTRIAYGFPPASENRF